MTAFAIWTITALVFVTIGISTWKSKGPAGFFTFGGPPKIPEKNVRKYNHAVAGIWFVFGALFEALGIPLLFMEQNSPFFLIPALGVPALVIGIIIAYIAVQNRSTK